MSNITATMVGQLRETTGLGMMECKKALVETQGDFKKAEEVLRIRSGAKAGKVAGRIAAEGIVTSYISADNKIGVLLEVNSETDFVAKDSNFINFTHSIAQSIVNNKITDITALNASVLSSGKTTEDTRKDVIAKLGENISIRRFQLFSTMGNVVSYLHGNKIGVIVDIIGGDIQLGKDIAMHIAACKPICVSKENVAQDIIDGERNIYIQRATNSGKPAEIVNKMVEGQIKKFLSEITLLGQSFVKDPDITIEQLLKNKNAKINAFAIFTVGEGIEKKEIDFAAEVAAAAVLN